MIRKIARYVVKESQVEDVKSAVEKFVSAIKSYEEDTVYHA